MIAELEDGQSGEQDVAALKDLELGEAQEELLRLSSVEGDGSLGIVASTFELVDDARTEALVHDASADSKRTDMLVLLLGCITRLSALDEDTTRRSRRRRTEDGAIGEVRREVTTYGTYCLGTVPGRGVTT